MKRSQRGLQWEKGGKNYKQNGNFAKRGWEFAISNDHGALQYQFLCRLTQPCIGGGEAFQGHSVEEASVKHFWGVKLFHMSICHISKKL